MKPIVFLDMDGVLADFDRGVGAHFDFDYSKTNRPSEELPPDLRAAKDALWNWVRENPEFWTNLAPMPDAKHLWENTTGVGFQTRILTAAPSRFKEGEKDFQEVARRKFEWIKENLGMDDPSRFICTTSKKKPLFMAAEIQIRNVLIDDREENIRDWSANGGTGILHRNAKDSIQILNQHVNPWLPRGGLAPK